MHELLLFGQVPAVRHEQVLKILAGLCAMQPQRVIERHAVYKPTQVPGQQKVAQAGGSQTIQQQRPSKEKQTQNVELFYVQLVQALNERDFGESVQNGTHSAAVTNSTPEKPWTMQFQDVPQPGKRAVLLRQTSKTKITEGDAHQFMLAQGNRFVNTILFREHCSSELDLLLSTSLKVISSSPATLS